MKKIWIAGACVILLAVVVLWIVRERPESHMQVLTPTIDKGDAGPITSEPQENRGPSVKVIHPTTTEKETARPAASDPGEGIAQGEDAIQKTARSWMTAVLKGQLDKLSAQTETPFCLFDQTVDTAGALKTNLDAMAKGPALARISKLHASGGFPITKVQVLDGEQTLFVAGRSFKSLATTGLILVRVRLSGEVEGERGAFDFVVVVKPGEQLRVVGFGED